MTNEQKIISNKNNKLLRKQLGIYGNTDLVLHHVDKTLKKDNIERYIQWNEEDVVIMTRGEHTKLHYNEIFTEENKAKMNWTKGKSSGAKGKHWVLSDETKNKLSEVKIGHEGASLNKHWYNNGVKESYYYEGEEPEGFVRGRMKRYAELT